MRQNSVLQHCRGAASIELGGHPLLSLLWMLTGKAHAALVIIYCKNKALWFPWESTEQAEWCRLLAAQKPGFGHGSFINWGICCGWDGTCSQVRHEAMDTTGQVLSILNLFHRTATESFKGQTLVQHEIELPQDKDVSAQGCFFTQPVLTGMAAASLRFSQEEKELLYVHVGLLGEDTEGFQKSSESFPSLRSLPC